jgi:FkbM family methyltransferase
MGAVLTSYAQNFEDVILWRVLKETGPRTYLDIGAYDPRIDSVTRGLYELGFRGVHVEPLPERANALRQDRPDEQVKEGVVSTSSSDLDFYSINGTGVSTLNPELIRKVAGDVQMSMLKVKSFTLQSLLDNFDGPIGFLKVDVEGAEADVIRSWGNSFARPWIVVVEATLPLTNILSHYEWEGMLQARGYHFVYFDGLNRFYIHGSRNELRKHFGPGPNVFDDFRLAASTPYVRHLVA